MTLDKTLFTSLGINLPKDQAEAFEKHFLETLEERVGLAIFDLLSDEEAEELIRLQDKADETTVTNWIKTNVPEYEDIVKDEFDILMGEVAENADLVTA
jgi:hypothetical protein